MTWSSSGPPASPAARSRAIWPEPTRRWGAAGRDPAKLKRTLADVEAAPAETIAADVGDPDSLARMAARASVVLNLVGPYTTRGRPVIEACVEAGAHYVDLTGEIPFVREIVADFDVAATEAEVKVVQVCGFEALPPDLAVQLAADDRARALGGRARAGRRDDRDHRSAARHAPTVGRDVRRARSRAWPRWSAPTTRHALTTQRP